MHRSFWPRHLSHASCCDFSFLVDFTIPDVDSIPEKQLEESGRGILDKRSVGNGKRKIR